LPAGLLRRDSDSSSPGYLFFEQRQDALLASEHISKRDGDRMCPLVLKLEDQELRDPLGHSLDVTRIYCFIGRDQHEVLDFELPRQMGSVIRSKDVVGNRLKAVLLHHGDMLIGCRMKHEMRAVLGHHVTQTVAIQNVSDQRGIIQPWEVLCEIDVDLVQVALRLVEK